MGDFVLPSPFALLASLFLIVFLTAPCAPLAGLSQGAQGDVRLTPASFEHLPGWKNDQVFRALPALRRSCAVYLKRPARRPLMTSGIGGTYGDWHEPCRHLMSGGLKNDQAVRDFLSTWFTPHLVGARGGAEGLFTGYFEAELRGSRKREGRFQYPLYAPPKDLVRRWVKRNSHGEYKYGRLDGKKLRPHLTRQEVENGALSGKGLEILWVDDPVDAFFLHIQGSGRVRLTDGSTVHVGFAGKNGHRFLPIGRLLIEKNEIPKEEMSMQAIRAWINDNPEKGRALMAENPSYIFFRILKEKGPKGSFGVPLTAGRSLAVDRSHIPLGVPLWLDTTRPNDKRKPLRRLVVAQDTGSAIKGVVRGDLFWGFGKRAASLAGKMKQQGRYYLLLPKTLSARIESPRSKTGRD